MLIHARRSGNGWHSKLSRPGTMKILSVRREMQFHCNGQATSVCDEWARIHERDIILWLSWPVNYNNRYHLNCRLRLRAISRGKCRIVNNETEGNKTKKEKKSNIVRCLIRNVKTNNSGVSLKNRAVKILDF